MWVKFYEEVCCEECNEVEHNHFDCPECNRVMAATNIYHQIDMDDVGTSICCNSCKSKFEIVGVDLETRRLDVLARPPSWYSLK